MATVETANHNQTMVEQAIDEALFKVIGRTRIELPSTIVPSNRLAFHLVRKLADHAEEHHLGAVSNNRLFAINSEKKINCRPDVSFVSQERWLPEKPTPKEENGWDVVPALAVEIMSPTDQVEELTQKIVEYFEATV